MADTDQNSSKTKKNEPLESPFTGSDGKPVLAYPEEQNGVVYYRVTLSDHRDDPKEPASTAA